MEIIVASASLFQAARWTIVAASVVFGAWMLYAGICSVGSAPIGWVTPLLGLLFLVWVAPFGLIAYFGIVGKYRSFFTTIIFLFSVLIFFFSSSVLLHIRFTDLMETQAPTVLVQAFLGFFLSLLQVAAPFIPAILFFRLGMRLLAKSGFPATPRETGC